MTLRGAGRLGGRVVSMEPAAAALGQSMGRVRGHLPSCCLPALNPIMFQAKTSCHWELPTPTPMSSWPYLPSRTEGGLLARSRSFRNSWGGGAWLSGGCSSSCLFQAPAPPASKSLCANQGVCLQQWDGFTCDSTMTSYGGPICNDRECRTGRLRANLSIPF